ncbi:MAG: CpsD/CapB family tyrosine-protein kinase [Candidatus Omnitrophica bacterium]|nr:CpsD/CapB family tyrosine-protein kinase [Candidatus Omnitrophota bacterium]
MDQQETQVKYEFVARKTVESNIDPRIMTFYDTKSPVTEQYRTLRTNLTALSSGSKPLKAVTITSSTHGEGKTISSINLAITMAQDLNSKSILLIDADMRRSKVNRYLGVPVSEGLSEILSGTADIEKGLLNIGIPNLTVMLAGKAPQNPAELLGSVKMKELINKLKARFDFIIIDAPPIVPVTDVGIFGRHTDGAIMVVQANRTQKGVIRHAQGLLQQAQIDLLGYILTDIRYHIPAYIYRYL